MLFRSEFSHTGTEAPTYGVPREPAILQKAMFDAIKRIFRKRFGKDREFYAVIDRLLGITPDNIELYKLALIHRSASVTLPDGAPANNERLEFLGDAVLETIVSDFLFIEYPEQTEGFLTQMRSRIVSRASLDEISSKMGIDKYIDRKSVV